MGNADSDEGIKNSENNFNQEIYSKVVRAGKRTYFFDVKTTRSDEYYLTITESKKRFNDNGKYKYEKHKIFLYKEDFDKFSDCLSEIIAYIRENQPAEDQHSTDEVTVEKQAMDNFTNVQFEDI
ncbi:MAG: DNA-binding protein [Draconibacterium sp.]|nr:MAG: DNA-binding protein [Draconibacterium sp.]PIF06480.1 MAG: DNA-binding protein [Draconibacterium sp.]